MQLVIYIDTVASAMSEEEIELNCYNCGCLISVLSHPQGYPCSEDIERCEWYGPVRECSECFVKSYGNEV